MPQGLWTRCQGQFFVLNPDYKSETKPNCTSTSHLISDSMVALALPSTSRSNIFNSPQWSSLRHQLALKELCLCGRLCLSPLLCTISFTLIKCRETHTNTYHSRHKGCGAPHPPGARSLRGVFCSPSPRLLKCTLPLTLLVKYVTTTQFHVVDGGG